MNIHLHIERLILDGIDLSPGQRPLLQAAVETELSQLLQGGDLSSDMRGGGAFREIQGSTIHLANTQPLSLGQQIAGAVHRGMQA